VDNQNDPLDKLREALKRSRPWAAEDAEDAQIIKDASATANEARMQELKRSSEDFNARVHLELAEIPVPPTLRAQVLARGKIVRVPFFSNRTAILAAAAAALVLLATAIVFLVPHGSGSEDMSLAGFQSRMVGFALREYRMDVFTADMGQLRKFLSAGGTPAEFQLPATLARTPIKGGACLSWQGKPVSMVCFDSPEHRTIYMFVMADSNGELKKGTVEKRMIKDMPSVSWSSDGKTFLLAGKISEKALQALVEG
jgi:hypothetical protein